MQHTQGKWKLGKIGGTVVTDATPENSLTYTGHDDREYYGGFLIAESILTKEDAKLIAAAPEMANLLDLFATLNENYECYRSISGLILRSREILQQLD